MQRGCWYTLIVFEFSVRSLSNEAPWLPPLFVLGIFLRCLLVDRSALLLIETDNNSPYRCTRGPAEDDGRVLAELHVEVGILLVHAVSWSCAISAIPFAVQMA